MSSGPYSPKVSDGMGAYKHPLEEPMQLMVQWCSGFFFGVGLAHVLWSEPWYAGATFMFGGVLAAIWVYSRRKG
jgi:hypothetical protein